MFNLEDVHTTEWFYNYVQWMYCNNIVSGYNRVPPCAEPGNTCYKPGNPTTRGQMAKIIVRAFQFPINTAGGPHYPDVAPGSTFYNYIETGTNMGIISGYPDGYYRPDTSVTRGQISKIAVNAAIIADPANWSLENPSSNQFEDVPVGSTYFQVIQTAVSHGVLVGYPCGAAPAGPCVPPANKPYFLPSSDASRAQIAKITYLTVNYPPPGNTQK